MQTSLFWPFMLLVTETRLQSKPVNEIDVFCPLQCIVIGLQSTGESRTREVLDENDGHLDRFVSAAE